MSKKTRNMLVWIGAAIILVVSLAILIKLPHADPPDRTTSQEKLKINNMSINDLKTIVVENLLDYYTVDVDSGNGSIAQLSGLPVSQSKFTELCSDCSCVAASQIIAEDVSNMSDFGLKTPKSKVEITYIDDTVLELNIGDLDTNSTGVYVSTGYDNTVYLFPTTRVDAFSYAKTDYVDKYITAEVKSGETSPMLTNLKLDGSVRKQAIELSGTPQAGYTITSPINYPADNTKINDISKQLIGLKSTKVVAINITQADIEKYGFSKPYSRVYAKYNDREYTLLSTQSINGMSYVLREGVPIIYQINGEQKSVFTDTLENVISKAVLTKDLSQLKNLTLKSGSETYTFDVSSNPETSNFTVNYLNTSIDSNNFKVFYNNLLSAKKQSFTTEAINQNNLILTCSLVYNDDTKDELSFYTAMDVSKALMSLNGVCDSTENKSFTDKLISDCRKLVSNQAVEPVSSSDVASSQTSSVSSSLASTNSK